MLRLRDLPDNTWFRFVYNGVPSRFQYQYRGNGWHGRPYSGGPWLCRDNPVVIDCGMDTPPDVEEILRKYANS